MFVNTEKYARLMWFLSKTGLLDEEGDFMAFNVKFKAYVEALVAGRS